MIENRMNEWIQRLGQERRRINSRSNRKRRVQNRKKERNWKKLMEWNDRKNMRNSEWVK